MANKILQGRELDKLRNYVGTKTLNLQKCVDWGYDVPQFVAIPSSAIKELYVNEAERNETARQAADVLGSEKYAVRSSALIEDSENQSYAGQFLTKINLSGDMLAQGISEVIAQAKEFLRGDLDKFSLIIQEYIAPDIAGVTFTRSPNGSREMMIEYGYCTGEKIVSGATKPATFSFYWNEPDIARSESRITDQMVEIFKQLEQKHGQPQDIEWCLKGGRFYLLQTRPITTISKTQYQQIIFLDETLPKQEKYLYEKTEISEIAPRPTASTLDLLKRAYSKNGPIDKVCQRYGVAYRNTDFLKIIGNELYVDREKEIKGLLPSYSYLAGTSFLPKYSMFAKTIPTVKNILALNKIRTRDYDPLFRDLKAKIESLQPETDVEAGLEMFLSDYKTVFETNLRSGLSLKKLSVVLKNEPIRVPEILREYSLFGDIAKFQVDQPTGIKGNTIELSDDTVFVANDIIIKEPSAKMLRWWQAASSLKKKRLQRIIYEAIIYNRLREYGRWLAVKNVNVLRAALLCAAGEKGFTDPRNIFFAQLADVISNRVTESSCVENKTDYEKYGRYNLPARLAHTKIVEPAPIIGVSSGLARGVIQNREFIDRAKTKEKNYILYTEILHPELTKYFDRISGIVSNNGGLLSHLAIIAREKNIPVIVGCELARSGAKLGDHVQIDGDSGKIAVIRPKSLI